MKHRILTSLFLLLLISIYSLSKEDFDFCLEREFIPILHRNEDLIVAPVYSENPTRESLEMAFEYSKLTRDSALATDCHYRLATLYQDLDSAIQWILLARAENARLGEAGDNYEASLDNIKQCFPAPADSLIITVYSTAMAEEDYYPIIKNLEHYNPLIEELAKSWIDQISVERSDSAAFALIADFRDKFPASKWRHAALQFELFHLLQKEENELVLKILTELIPGDIPSEYILNLYRLSPSLRKNLSSEEQTQLLNRAIDSVDNLLLNLNTEQIYQIQYDSYTAPTFCNKLLLLKAKAMYYSILLPQGLIGDEDDCLSLFKKSTPQIDGLLDLLQNVEFEHNDAGDLAELYFWRAKACGLLQARKMQLNAAESFATCLIYGAPRKRYDEEAYTYFQVIHARLKIKSSPLQWMRKLMKYEGIVFEDISEQAGFADFRYSRVALADYDNDGYCDILLNGTKLLKNNGNMSFTDVSQQAGLDGLVANGGLFADFNKDGLLDFVTISHAEDGRGEQLMKNMDGSRFASVNSKAGDIDDQSPTEGAAWVDTRMDGYPGLYLANYEKWQVQPGYQDYWWENTNGSFADRSAELGFRTEAYTHNPGLAGRGVAPADFNNDGVTDILVTNYRLARNYLWVKAGDHFYDLAAQLKLQGKEVNGYYGHSIGADWGDYDNDGDLDLFIANLAHPRFIEFSDVSMLLRNDGLQMRVIGADSVYYWQFTDVTSEAGITFDELHSDPLWFDADNDGLLDLFITSVYQNDRSYLYRNNGDGTFTDVTWLAGARVYNGWGNATADLDRDGRLDLVVGSGNGTRLLRNVTATRNKSIIVKPVWIDDEVVLLNDRDSFASHPNTPAFGTRVRVTLQDKSKATYSLIRELQSAKGTTSQNEPVLHFGIADAKVIEIKRERYDTD